MAELADALDLGSSGTTVWVQVPLSAPRRCGLHMFAATFLCSASKVTSHSFRRSSSPNRIRFAGFRFGLLSQQPFPSTLTAPSLLPADFIGAGLTAVGDKDLFSVEQIVVSFILCRCLRPAGIRACIGFGQTKCAEFSAGTQIWEIFFLFCSSVPNATIG